MVVRSNGKILDIIQEEDIGGHRQDLLAGLELCKKNATNRAKQTNYNTCGPKSFAVIRERLKKEHNREPTLAEMFKKTRTRVLGRVYKETGEDTQDPNGGIAIPTKLKKWGRCRK
ncbi:hypothetical protein Dimus_010483 [Dionaea muscipula]